MRTSFTEDLTEVEDRLVAAGWKRRSVAKKLAREAEISDTTYRRWRNGENQPIVDQWYEILDLVDKIEKRERRNGMARQRRRDAKDARSRGQVREPDRRRATP